METVEALQSAISGTAAKADDSDRVGMLEPSETFDTSKILQLVLKRIVKLTMETTSAMALASMNDRRATN